MDDPAKVEEVLVQAFAQPGPAVVEALVDPNRARHARPRHDGTGLRILPRPWCEGRRTD